VSFITVYRLMCSIETLCCRVPCCVPVPAQVLGLRQEKAKILGFDNFSQLSMASKVRGRGFSARGVGSKGELFHPGVLAGVRVGGQLSMASKVRGGVFVCWVCVGARGRSEGRG
jgi:hypothetical protein